MRIYGWTLQVSFWITLEINHCLDFRGLQRLHDILGNSGKLEILGLYLSWHHFDTRRRRRRERVHFSHAWMFYHRLRFQFNANKDYDDDDYAFISHGSKDQLVTKKFNLLAIFPINAYWNFFWNRCSMKSKLFGTLPSLFTHLFPSVYPIPSH